MAAKKGSKSKRGKSESAESGGASSSGYGSKMAFIRAHPDLSPGEVAAKAKEAGFSFEPKYVSTVRSIDRRKNGEPPKRRGRKPGVASAAAAKAPRARAGRAGAPNKAEFVRSVSFDLPVAEVIKLAAQKGISLTSAHVHTIRTAERTRLRKQGQAPKTGGGRGKASAPAASAPISTGKGVGHEIARLVLDHGYHSVQTALESVRQRLAQLL
jgi:hypothetical protein